MQDDEEVVTINHIFMQIFWKFSFNYCSKRQPALYFSWSQENKKRQVWCLTCQSPWLRKFIQSRWKQRSPRAAAQLHLDSRLSERQACSPHCPDSYRCNCVPVGEEQQRELATALPATHSKTGDMLQWRLWSAGAFSSLPRETWVPLLSA